MSGTSLDGLDIAYCTFYLKENKWTFEIIEAITYKYSDNWKVRLAKADNLQGYDLVLLHNDFGLLISEYILQFLNGKNYKIDFISSHGHTIFHQPQLGLTFQIGSGAVIASKTGILTICDFRSLDVALGGQGAPLVPIGDRLLFYQYCYCLNLGGFANISFDDNSSNRVAFDICPVNIVLNDIVGELGLEFDANGEIGRRGEINHALLNEINQLDFYYTYNPKSLGKEWVNNIFMPVIKSYKISVDDKLRTLYDHITYQIGKVLENKQYGKILISGGGTWNTFLLQLLKENLKIPVEIPSEIIIDFKEALIFAFLGVLRIRNEINCLSSVTGASTNSSGGIIYEVKG